MAYSNKKSVNTHYKTFEPLNQIKFLKIKGNAGGKGQTAGMLNSSINRAIFLETPLMMNWGIQEYCDEKTGQSSWSVCLQFPDEDNHTPETRQFLKVLLEMEEAVRQAAIDNSMEWMGMDEEEAKGAVKFNFKGILKYPYIKDTKKPDMTRPPQLKVKLPFWDGKFSYNLFDTSGKKVYPLDENHPDFDPDFQPENFLNKTSHAIFVLRCGGVWFTDGKFGVSFKLNKAVVDPAVRGRNDDEADVDMSAFGAVRPPLPPTQESVDEPTESSTSAEVSADVASDNEEEEPAPVDQTEVEEDDEPTPEEEPEEKPKKKRVIRKKKET